MEWFGRHRRPPEENPDVKAAMDARDEVLAQADDAIRAVDRVQNSIIAEYAAAEEQRLKNGRRRKR